MGARRRFKMPKMFAHIQAVVRKIPRGKVATYGEVARAAGYPGASRQVVWALRAGRGLPWHRVLGAGGRIRLPGEAGFEQRLRQEAEGVVFQGSRVPMETYGAYHRRAKGSRGKKKTRGAHRRSRRPA